MFYFDETDLFDRYGYKKITNDITYNERRYYTLSDGTTIPIMHYPFNPKNLTRHLVLKTYLGYIPVENINKFSDIFNKDNYLKDDTEWILPYLLQQKDIYNEEIIRLSNILGKHWKSHSCIEEIKPKRRLLRINDKYNF